MKELMSNAESRALIHFMGRLLLYAVLLGAIAFGMLWGAVHYGPKFYDEIGPVETLETVFAMGTALVMLSAGRKNEQCAPCAVMVAGFLFCVAVRESDYFLDVLVGRHTWKVVVGGLAVSFAVYFFRNLRAVATSIADFMRGPAFGVFISGLLVLIIFSRLFGYGGFWEELVPGWRYQVVKTIVEEGVEQMGYFLLLVSSIEYGHSAKVHMKKTSGPHD